MAGEAKVPSTSMKTFSFLGALALAAVFFSCHDVSTLHSCSNHSLRIAHLAAEEVVDSLPNEGLALDRVRVNLSGLLLAEGKSVAGSLGEVLVKRLLNLLGLLGLGRGGLALSLSGGGLGVLLSNGILQALNLS